MNSTDISRRSFLSASAIAATTTVLASCGSNDHAATVSSSPAALASDFESSMIELENQFGRRIGVTASELSGRQLRHRADERFLHCSTAKVITAAAVLKKSEQTPGLLTQRLTYRTSNVVPHSPITAAHVHAGISVDQACAAALTVSDNTAENLLLSLIGGPNAVTGFVRGLGDRDTRCNRDEPALNERTSSGLDTTTPAAMAANLHALILGQALNSKSRAQLNQWMRACTTGDHQIRAGAPKEWTIADKTGGGNNAESNDIAVLWPPHQSPIILTIYTDAQDHTSTNGPEAIAATTRATLKLLD